MFIFVGNGTNMVVNGDTGSGQKILQFADTLGSNFQDDNFSEFNGFVEDNTEDSLELDQVPFLKLNQGLGDIVSGTEHTLDIQDSSTDSTEGSTAHGLFQENNFSGIDFGEISGDGASQDQWISSFSGSGGGALYDGEFIIDDNSGQNLSESGNICPGARMCSQKKSQDRNIELLIATLWGFFVIIGIGSSVCLLVVGILYLIFCIPYKYCKRGKVSDSQWTSRGKKTPPRAKRNFERRGEERSNKLSFYC